MSPVVQLTQAVALVGRFPALAGVDLTVGAGEIVLVRGPNGAGKSTLLRLCAGLVPLHRGQGRVLDLDLARRGDRVRLRRQVGLLAHATFLYEDLTVEQNLRFWAAANRAEPELVDAVMARLGLDGRLRAVPVTGLSAGQRRRTSIAAMVCRRPRLWLLDEPHAGLDAQGRDLLDDLVRDAVAAGATAVVASHELERAAGLATRTVVLAGGATRAA
jgi:heme ABC exporter ATP-binding subunit CcmA